MTGALWDGSEVVGGFGYFHIEDATDHGLVHASFKMFQAKGTISRVKCF